MSTEWDILGRLVKAKKPVIFQVGVNRASEMPAFKRMWPEADFWLFEPRRDAIKALRERLGDDQHIHLVNKAVSKTEALTDFHITFYPGQSSLLKRNTKSKHYVETKRVVRTIKVQTVTLDNFCARRGIGTIDLLHIDIQGGELAAFEGAAGLLERASIDVIFTEVFFMDLYQNCPQFADVRQYLEKYGYEFRRFFSGRGSMDKPTDTWADALFVKGD